MHACTMARGCIAHASRVRRQNPMVVLFAPVSFFFNYPATTQIYTLSLHDALPIFHRPASAGCETFLRKAGAIAHSLDRKSTRLNSSHLGISYAVFCLKKKKNGPGIASAKRGCVRALMAVCNNGTESHSPRYTSGAA